MCVQATLTHFLLATLVASPFDTRLSLLLVVFCGAVAIAIAINAGGAVAHYRDRASLALLGAIGAETGRSRADMGKDLAPNGDGAGGTEGGSGSGSTRCVWVRLSRGNGSGLAV